MQLTQWQSTIVGSMSIILWGTLALLSQLAGPVPPFQLLALTFGIAFLLMLTKWAICKQPLISMIKQPPLAWFIGVGGLFGFHLCYFFAIKNAPIVDVSLISYLWPLFIVLFSSLLPNETLLKRYIIGAIVALIGCWLLISNNNASLNLQYSIGYIAAFGCALIWSGYSVASRFIKNVPTDTVGLFCGCVALLATLFHLLLEEANWQLNLLQWLSIIGLGIGPIGIAFFTWDHGVKHGNLQLLSVIAYSTPLISTIILILFNQATATINVLFACIAIVVGALIAMPARKGHLKNSDLIDVAD
ncbi:DMT family transporter [Spartinivicinus poritis]|uniref:EamA family transporter n=1 Tax=Spartinivicinus poritis TaxID=2994640 RepID=A0ABT5UBS3_9GAMM|nr:EamA family transporter [Spartinivicinus sp. A2-2]MDE1463835.1 EamA family transporter [Spartinivicinus sp. A2-2]